MARLMKNRQARLRTMIKTGLDWTFDGWSSGADRQALKSQEALLVASTASPPRFRPIVSRLYELTALAPRWSRSLLPGVVAALRAFAFDTLPAMTYSRRGSSQLEQAQDFSNSRNGRLLNAPQGIRSTGQ